MPEELVTGILADASHNWQLKALLSGVVLAAALLLKWLTVRIIRRRIQDPTVRLVWTQIANGTIILILIIVLSWAWMEGVGSILALLTLVAAAMTIVHKELILNFSSWSIIAWRGLFQLGDFVEVGPNIGKVIDLGPMYFTLSESTSLDTGMRPTGRTIRVPNGQVLTNAVVNYSDQGMRWVDLAFPVAADADWEKGRQIIDEVIQEESAALDVDRSDAEDLTVTIQLKESKVVLTAHYPTKPGQRLASQTRVTRKILERLGRAGIKLQ